MPFCYSPWTNIDISPQGVLSPCCKFQLKHYHEKFDVRTSSLADYVDSKFLTDVRDQFKNGEWPAGCERCKSEEHNGIDSKRKLDKQRWQEHYDLVDLENSEFITASIAFGNTCNLKCITCDSKSSSKWYQEYLDVYGVEAKPVHFYRQDFVESVIAQIPNVIHLDIPGGEPLISGVQEQHQLLQYYIDSGRASDISLHYTTNASIFPDAVWQSQWQHFKEVDIQLSIDGIGSKYEYIRYPANWNTLSANVQQYVNLAGNNYNVRLSVSHTVSAYNILYIPEFLQWCKQVGLPQPWLGKAHRPLHMKPEVWPEHARQFIKDELLKDSDAISHTWANTLDEDASQNFDDFVKYTKIHDENRKLDFRTTFPELAPYYEK